MEGCFQRIHMESGKTEIYCSSRFQSCFIFIRTGSGYAYNVHKISRVLSRNVAVKGEKMVE